MLGKSADDEHELVLIAGYPDLESAETDFNEVERRTKHGLEMRAAALVRKNADGHPEVVEADLALNPEVLAEPIQTVMRRYGIEQPYEKLKELTRGQRIDAATLAQFITGLDLPEGPKQALLALKPRDYVGKAVSLANEIR